MKVAITTSSFAQFSQKPLELLQEQGIRFVLNPYGRALNYDESIELLQDCVGVAAGTEELSERVMAALPKLRVISRCGVGMDNVDLQAAAQRHIIVCSTPNGPTQAVAELTLGLALDLLRNVTSMDKALRAGIWKKQMGHLLSRQHVGIIGFGRIGTAVARAFLAMGCRVSFYDPHVVSSSIPDCTRLEMKDLLAQADIVTLHCAKPQNGQYILSAEAISAMKPSSWLINVARGGIIDEQALYTALKTGGLKGAAIDTFAHEPYTGSLAELDNVILTPHIGSYAQESRIQMEIDTISNLINALCKNQI